MPERMSEIRMIGEAIAAGAETDRIMIQLIEQLQAQVSTLSHRLAMLEKGEGERSSRGNLLLAPMPKLDQ